MPATYERIASTTLASTTSTITLSSISSAYTDLRLVLVAFGSGNFNMNVRYNNNSSNIYCLQSVRGNGASASYANSVNQSSWNLSQFANYGTTPFIITFDIFSYANSQFKTTLITEANDRSGAGIVEAHAGLFANGGAIDTIDIISGAQHFSAGTTVSLYGILRA
jgi:hypothetical protein